MEGSAGSDPALDVALQEALLHRVAEGRRAPALRCYRPRPTVAFGRRDRFLPGFSEAAQAARRHGFTPVIRGAGGRAAAYDEGCLVLDEIMPAVDSIAGIQARFADSAALHARALRALGVDARVGELPGEYCPGAFSVNARGAVKLVGAAQRIIRGGWLLSSVVVVRAAAGAAVRAVLLDVYDALGLDWDPETAGSLAGEVPRVDLDDVHGALLREYEREYALAGASLTAAELAAAGEILDRYRVDT